MTLGKKRSIPVQLEPFINPGTIVIRSPGRINLIGEHTDYNDGFVLPAAIDKAIYVAIEKKPGNTVTLHSIDFNESVELGLDELAPRPGHWSTYILGVIDQLQKRGNAISGFHLVIYGDVPLGAGLSSSAAVECGTAFALNELFKFNIDRKELALISQMAEHKFAGVKCGIMDQFASLMGKKDHVIRLDCRSLTYEYFPLRFQGYKIVLFDSQVKHSLASSAYNERRQECEQGVMLLQKKYPEVKSLRDATLPMIAELEHNSVIYKRCKYVVEENVRVVEGCKDLLNADPGAFGKKMYATHNGLSELYEVSCSEIDFLVDAATKIPAIAGSRMMGGGFGGCTINIIKEEMVEAVTRMLSEQYIMAVQRELKTYIVGIENGTSVLSQ
jgi:galactokinase